MARGHERRSAWGVKSAGAKSAAWCVVAALSLSPVARGQEPTPSAPTSSAPTDEPPTLGRYLDALASQRLLAAETGSLPILRDELRRAEALYFDRRYGDAALVLYEIVESPRFSDFTESDDFLGAELLAASALAELGSLRTSARYLERILRRGTSHGYFGPAYRRFVDVTLQSGDLRSGLATLEALDLQGAELPEDAQNELRYLRARASYDRGELDVRGTRSAEDGTWALAQLPKERAALIATPAAMRLPLVLDTSVRARSGGAEHRLRARDLDAGELRLLVAHPAPTGPVARTDDSLDWLGDLKRVEARAARAIAFEAPDPPGLVSVLAAANYLAEHNERACREPDFFAEVPNLGSLATDRPTFDWLMRAADVDVRLLMIAFGV